MHACSACLVTLFLSEERTWTLRPPAILHRLLPYHNFTIPYHTIPYHTIPYHTIPYHGCATVDATSGYAWL